MDATTLCASTSISQVAVRGNPGFSVGLFARKQYQDLWASLTSTIKSPQLSAAASRGSDPLSFERSENERKEEVDNKRYQ